MIERLRDVFKIYQVEGQVTIEYDTEVTYGHLH
jgi:hypothetical protein